MAANCVFLSYSRKDLDYARTLHDQLEAAGVTVWWDQEEAAGEDWTEQLLTWLETAHAVVVLVTRHSVVSLSVKNEVLLAQDYQRRVIPVLLEQARGGLWVLIRSLQWVDVREGRGSLGDLLIALQVQQPTVAPPGDHTFPAMNSLMLHQEPPSASLTQAQVTIVLPGEIGDFSDRERSSLIQIVARFASLQPDQIRIVRVEAGSIRVTLELPESSARWLVALYTHQAALIELLDIQAVYDVQVLPAQNKAAKATAVVALRRVQLRGWFQRRTRLSLALSGALLLVVVLAVSLRSAAGPEGMPIGLVANIQGTLDVQRAGWNSYVAVATGTTLRAGDRLRVSAGGQASVVCADGTAVVLQAATQPVPCSSNTNRFIFAIDQAEWANAVLSSAEAAVPRVIVPRASILLTTTPTIRWTAVEDRARYTVVLRREGAEIWRKTVENSATLVYPADQLALESGPLYRFVVTADNGQEERAQGTGVQVLGDEQAAALQADGALIAELALEAEAKRLLLANQYAQNGLYAEALVLLETPSTSAEQARLQLLGDLYLAVGLPDLAIAPYNQALAAATTTASTWAEAQANRMLGLVHSRLGGAENRTRAIVHYQQALQFIKSWRCRSAKRIAPAPGRSGISCGRSFLCWLCLSLLCRQRLCWRGLPQQLGGRRQDLKASAHYDAASPT
ncbi:toll/interleukin-1 receptor domain-containing protein [Candidatus Gracilibacteria bacterium]|nr:toll/interleukin-1 receptor domain-containing protein [Candidatus Gracilibacteria bacterium]